MRMDRYDEDLEIDKKTRTNKNQELYTDVYLNNAYVDINELNEEINEETKEETESNTIKYTASSYTYVKKNYDINSIIEEAIIKHGNDNIKRSLEDNLEIDNIIESINESHLKKDNNEELLSDLLPDSDTTTIVSGLEGVVDTKVVDTSVLHKNDMSNDMIDDTMEDEIIVKKTKKIESKETKEEDQLDETRFPKKTVFIIVGILLIIIIVLVILYFKGVIKI